MIVLKVTKFLNFTEIKDTGKTKIVGVGNNAGEKLGLIKWHGPWRKYVFTPITDSIYDVKCLIDIIAFIKELTDQRK
jgi:hypothetical protein